ncbi:acetyltransferase [Minwuia sp.]|uniref:acetyltransferase n=1 Tax=Minwuia sp. TaxID=2493630 RepID=UPI003A920836
MGQIAIIGTGGHGRECIEAARAGGIDVVCLIDENASLWGSRVLDVEVARDGLNAISRLSGDVDLLVAVGDNAARKRIVADLTGRSFATLIHPFSWISPTARIGEGAMIFAGCVVQNGAQVGRHGILNTGATLSHDCATGDFSHVAVGARLAGNVTIGAGALIGAGVAARPGASVGDWATVGAGAVVIDDVPAGATAFGQGRAVPR